VCIIIIVLSLKRKARALACLFRWFWKPHILACNMHVGTNKDHQEQEPDTLAIVFGSTNEMSSISHTLCK